MNQHGGNPVKTTTAENPTPHANSVYIFRICFTLSHPSIAFSFQTKPKVQNNFLNLRVPSLHVDRHPKQERTNEN